MRDRLRLLRHLFLDPKEPRAEQYFREWHDLYNKYREIVLRHWLWNMAVEIYEPFTGSPQQLSAEARYLSDLEKAYNATMADREAQMLDQYERYVAEEQILSFLKNSKRKKATKKSMLASLSSSDVEKKKMLNRAYRSLLLRNIIGEKKKDDGSIETRFIVRRKQEESVPCYSLPPSEYRADFYNDVYKMTVLRAELTVDPPYDIDNETNTCKFKSPIDGTVYLTSLEMCTCPAFLDRPNEPCKHMVAFAKYLGYYSPIQ